MTQETRLGLCGMKLVRKTRQLDRVVPAFLVCVLTTPTALCGDTISSSYTYNDSTMIGTLSVTYETASTQWDELQIRCADDDTAAGFMVGTTNWALHPTDPIIMKPPGDQKYLKLQRASVLSSSETVVIGRMGSKRGRHGRIDAMLAESKGTGRNGTPTFLAALTTPSLPTWSRIALAGSLAVGGGLLIAKRRPQSVG